MLNLVLIVLCVAAPAPQAGPDVAQLRASIERILEAPGQSSAARGRDIAALGPGVVDAALEVLAARETFWCSGEIRPGEQALLHALELNVRWDLDHALAARADAGAPLAERGAGLAVLGEIGREDELGLAVALASPGEGGAIEPLLGAALGRTLARITLREPELWPRVAGQALSLEGPAQRHALQAFFDAELPRLGELLETLFGRDAAVDAWLLPRAVRWAEVRPEAPPALLRCVRRALGAPSHGARDGVLRREATLAAGRLGDWEALPLLLDALADSDAALRAASAEALRELTGLALREDPAAWRAWHAREERWWQVEAPACLAALGGTAAQAGAALVEIAGHRLRRDELAEAVAPLTELTNPDIVARAAAALGELGGRRAARALEPLLEHSREEVCSTARVALARVQAGLHAGKTVPGAGS